jgi:hypothetical protein
MILRPRRILILDDDDVTAVFAPDVTSAFVALQSMRLDRVADTSAFGSVPVEIPYDLKLTMQRMSAAASRVPSARRIDPPRLDVRSKNNFWRPIRQPWARRRRAERKHAANVL